METNILAIVISVIALLVSFITLYLTHLKAARIAIIAGEHLNIGHYIEGNLNITLPITFVNYGAKTATVKRVALLIQKSGNSEGYLLEPYFYQKVGDSGEFQNESQPTPIGVSGKQNITKQVLFRSSEERPFEFQLIKEGSYTFTLLGWVDTSEIPDISDTFNLEIEPEIATKLELELGKKTASTIRIPQATWRNWTSQKLKQYQVKGLLKR